MSDKAREALRLLLQSMLADHGADYYGRVPGSWSAKAERHARAVLADEPNAEVSHAAPQL